MRVYVGLPEPSKLTGFGACRAGIRRAYGFDSVETVKWDWRAFLVSKQQSQSSRQRECGADDAKQGCALEADSKVVMPCRVTRGGRLLKRASLAAVQATRRTIYAGRS